MKRKWMLLLVLLAALALAAGIGVKVYTDGHIQAAGKWVSRDAQQADLRGQELSQEDYHALQEALPECEILWDVNFQGKLVPSTTEKLQVTSLSGADLAVLDYFPDLKILDAAGCEDYDKLLAFQAARPACQVLYQVTLGGQAWPQDAAAVTVDNADGEELLEKLQYLPALTQVELSGVLPEGEALALLRSAYPQVSFAYEVQLQGKTFSSGAEALDLSGMSLAYEEVSRLLSMLPNVKTVDLNNSSLSQRELRDLADAFPQVFLLWTMTVGDHQVATDAEELDLSGWKMESTQEIEELLPYFKNLKKVVMIDCGFDDETMDALNQRHADVRFVWCIQIQSFKIRTDTTFFYPFTLNHNMFVYDSDLVPLRYCTDIVAIDIGHNTGVTHCEWAAYMPNLTYLILADTRVSDLTPLTGLKNLKYLEIFSTPVKDYTPLVTLTALEDLNLSRTYGHWEPISKMPWLKHLWWNGLTQTNNPNYDPALIHTAEELSPYLPNTKTQFGTGSAVIRNGWRELENYKAMRDIMGMFYLE